MQFSYVGTERDFIDAQRTHAWRKYSPRDAAFWKGLLIVLGLVLVGEGLLSRHWLGIGYLIIQFCMGFYLIFGNNVIAPILYRRAYRRRMTGDPYEVFFALSDDSLNCDCPGHSHTVMEWNMVKGVIESSTTILLYISAANFMIIPTRALSAEQRNELTDLLREKGIPQTSPKPVRKAVVK